MALEQILVVDDERDMAELIAFSLQRASYTTALAYSGTEAMRFTELEHPALIVLDVVLPDIDGYEVCRHIRLRMNIPIILHSAIRVTEEDRIRGLQAGADDCLPKSLTHRELLARVQAVLRRSQQPTGERDVVIGSHRLQIDTFQQKVKIDNRLVDLTTREYQLLSYFLQHPNRVLTCNELTEAIWQLSSEDTQSLKVHLCRMRRKYSRYLRDCPDPIESVRGVGYRFNLPSPVREPSLNSL